MQSCQDDTGRLGPARALVLPNYTDLQTLTVLQEIQETTLNLSECQKRKLKFKSQGNTLNRVIKAEGKRRRLHGREDGIDSQKPEPEPREGAVRGPGSRPG